MVITHITLTGAGEGTPVEKMVELSQQYPLAEWGLLYSPKRAGTEPRYPSYRWLVTTADRLHEAGCRIALHLCGTAVNEFLRLDATPARTLAESFDRVQINLPKERQFSALSLHHSIREFVKPVITQENEQNTLFNQAITAPNHSILFDASGGQGIATTTWPEYWSHKACGYAGGLSPDNIPKELPRINASAGTSPFWIDCEGRIRDENDQLSIDRCREMLRVATGIAYDTIYTKL